MFSSIKKIFDRFNNNEFFRYLVAGGCTTAVNLVVFCGLRYGVRLSLTKSNFIGILCAMVFAFFVNKFYAFRTEGRKLDVMVTEFVKFISGRLFTMVVEIVGVYILAMWIGLHDLLAKILTQIIVVVVNYLISKFIVFKKNSSGRTIVEWMKDNLLYELSFIVPLIIMGIVCFKNNIAPFGNQTLLAVDSVHQYLPFYSDYYDKIKESGEFLYSWNGGMGYNYVTLWSYYLSSPFLLLILLFPKTKFNLAMTLIIALKIASCSTSFTYSVDKMFDNKKDIKILPFGLAYSLSNYVIGYYWNNMWLDVLIMAPLVLLGVKKLVDEEDCRMYVITLFLALFGNFYIGFMLCIFLVFWFLFYPHKGVKSFFLSGVRFAISSLVAGGMAAFMLLPTYQGLMNTAPATSGFPANSWYGEWGELFRRFGIFVDVFYNDGNDGKLNIYCGIFTVFLGLLYFTVKEVSIFQKIKRLLLMALIFVSFNNSILNYIWHGFHDQFGIPNRFAFLLTLVLLITAYEGIRNYQDIGFFKFFVPLALLVAFAVVQGAPSSSTFYSSVYDTTVKWIYILYVVYYMLFMLNIMLEWKPIVFSIIVTVIAVGEVSANAIYEFGTNGQIDYTYYYNENADVWAAADSVDDGSWYREELSKNKTVDENFWYNLKSVGVFGSTANGDSVSFLNRLGFYTATNEHLYNGATPLTDTLLGVKYLYFREGDFFKHGFEYKDKVKNVEIYENKYPLAIGYALDGSIDSWDYNQYNPADNLNNFCNNVEGVDGQIYDLLSDEYTATGENCNVDYKGWGEGTYGYEKIDESSPATVTLSFTAKDDRPICYKATGTNLSGIEVKVNGELKADGRYFFSLTHVPDTKAGDEISITFKFNGAEESVQTVNLVTMAFNQDVFEKVYDKLKDEQLNVTSYDSNTINGEITVDSDKLMMTSVIYEPGFKVYVDGKEADIVKIGGSFIGVNLSAGTHKIKIEFVPKLLPIGLAVSFASLMIFILYIKLRGKPIRFKFKKADEEAKEQEA